MGSAFSILITVVGGLYLFAITAWTFGALYYDAGNRTARGWILGGAWLVLVVATIAATNSFGLAVLIISLVFLVVVFWWFTQKPSHERQWDPNFAELPRISIKDSAITVTNVRDTEYRSLDDYDCRFETRSYRRSDLKALDVLILYWGSTWMCHPMAIFDFGNGRHLCFSIEVRYRLGEEFNTLRNLFRQNEIMYVVCDERDAILRRTKYSEGHDCYLYRLQVSADHVREVFDEYVEATNRLFESPKWYNAVTANCTTTIYMQRRGKVAWDWRMLFNGAFDKMLYDRGRLYKGIPFDELKQKCWINDRANAASNESFGESVRRGLPGFKMVSKP